MKNYIIAYMIWENLDQPVQSEQNFHIFINSL